MFFSGLGEEVGKEKAYVDGEDAAAMGISLVMLVSEDTDFGDGAGVGCFAYTVGDEAGKESSASILCM
jgi:hypothetical protein